MNQFFFLEKDHVVSHRDLTVERKRESIIGGRKKAVEIFVSRREHCRAHSPLDACLLWLFAHASSSFLVLLEKKKMRSIL